MEADQILATGGAGGITGIALFILYKLLNKRIKSKCCGNTIELDIQTPQKIDVKVDEDTNHSQQNQRNDERSSRSSSCEDSSRKEGYDGTTRNGKDEECCSTSNNFERENPLVITIPKSL